MELPREIVEGRGGRPDRPQAIDRRRDPVRRKPALFAEELDDALTVEAARSDLGRGVDLGIEEVVPHAVDVRRQCVADLGRDLRERTVRPEELDGRLGTYA